MTDIYSNSKLKKFIKKREIDDDNYEEINNLDKNRKIVKHFIYNLKNKNNDNKYDNMNKENIITNKNNRKNIKRKNKESENLSEIADNLVDILDKKQEKQKDKITDEITYKENELLPFKMPDKIKIKNKFFIPKKRINIKKAKKILNNNYINNTEYSISNLPEIFYKSNKRESCENNINNNNKNNKNNELIVEHVFDYNHSDYNKIKENNDTINIFNKENILSRNTYKHNKENRPKKNSKDKKHLYNEEIIVINNNNDRLNSNNSYDKYDEEGEKVINSLIAQASQNNQNEEDIKNINIIEKDKDNPLNKIPKNIIIPKNINNEDIHKNLHEQIKKNKNLNKKQDKKVSFDENLIYINYNQNNKVINFNVSNQKNKLIQFKPINITKYFKILSSDTEMNKLKPVILNANKINVNNIINEITKKEENKKNKSNNIISLKNKITQRNIDFIKIVQERGTVYNVSKEKARKKVELKNCKKFEENPQHFFTEKICDNILESYNIHTKNKSRRPSSSKKNNSNSKKTNINKQ